MKLPKTRRFCPTCDDITLFRYNHSITHSRCCGCGGFWSNGKKIIEKRINELENEINQKLLDKFNFVFSTAFYLMSNKKRKIAINKIDKERELMEEKRNRLIQCLI